MTSLASLVDPTLVERLGWTLVHSLWQGVAIAAVSGILFFALRGARAQTRYLAACASLLLVVGSAAITFSMIAPASQPERTSTTAPTADAALVPPASTASTAASIASAATAASLTSSTSTASSVSSASPTSLTSSTSPSSTTTSTSPVLRSGSADVANSGNDRGAAIDRPFPLNLIDAYQRATMTIELMLPSLVTLWIVGLCFCSIRLLGGLALVARLKRHQTEPASSEWQQRLGALAHRMRVRGRDAISLRVSVNIRTAAVIGWLRPVILVPASALAGLTPQQMEAVLAHELAHIRRHDYLVNLLQSVVETLFFYHPAVWYLSRRVRLEREHCCDDDAVAVVGDPVTYAGALTDLELLRQGVPSLAMAANGGSLLRRVQRLLAQRSEDAAPSWSTATGLATLAIVFAVLATAHGSIAAGLQPESNGLISAIDNDGQWPTPPPPPAAPTRDSDYLPRVMPPPPPPPVPVSGDLNPVPPDVPAPPPAPVTRWVEPTPPPPPPATVGDQRRGLAIWGVPPPPPPAAPEARPAPLAPLAPDALPAPPAPPAPAAATALTAPRAWMTSPGQPPAPPAPAPVPEKPARPAKPAPAPKAAPVERATPPPPPPQPANAPQAPQPPQAPNPPLPPPGEGGIERAMNWIGSWFDFPEGGNRFTIHDGNRRFTVRSRGDVTVSDDDTDVLEISDGGYLSLEEKIGWDRSKVDIRHGADGRLQRTFLRNGKQVNFEPAGRAWLAKKMPDLVRNSGFGAEARVRRIHTAGGPAAVLDEVTKIKSNYVKRLYLSKLLDLRTVQGPMLTRLITQAGQEIDSDYERASILIEVAKDRLMTTDEQRLAYTVATRTIKSNYEHRRALQPLVESGSLSDTVLRSALDSASTIESDYELASLFVALAKTQTLTPAAMDAYLAAAMTIDSDYELGRALKPTVTGMTTLPSTVVRDVLKASHGIDSDYEMAQFLIALVSKQKLDDVGRAAFFGAVDSVHSDYERGRVLKAVAARPDLTDALVLGVIDSTRGMNSSYEAANVLRDVAAHYPLAANASLRKAYVDAAERLSSNHERDRVLVALVRTESSGR